MQELPYTCFLTMRIIPNRSTAWICGLAYLLASALSGLLHNHSHSRHSHSRHSHGPHIAQCEQAHSDEHRGEMPGHAADPSTPEPLSDDDCLACRFVAQCATVSVPMPDLAPRPIVAEVRVSAPIFFIEPVYSNALARAPPLG